MFWLTMMFSWAIVVCLCNTSFAVYSVTISSFHNHINSIISSILFRQFVQNYSTVLSMVSTFYMKILIDKCILAFQAKKTCLDNLNWEIKQMLHQMTYSQVTCFAIFDCILFMVPCTVCVQSAFWLLKYTLKKFVNYFNIKFNWFFK